jgi:hypothetical protein
MKLFQNSSVKNQTSRSFWMVASIGILAFAVSAGAGIVDRCSRLLKTEDYDAFVKEVSKDWSEIQEEYQWRVWIDSSADYQRFINPPDFAAKVGKVHPTEMYENGLKQYRAAKAGTDYLDAIPKGSFRPNVDLLKDLHKIVMKDVYSLAEKIGIAVTFGRLNLAGPGKFRRATNFGFPMPFLRKSLTDAEVANIRADGIVRFWSLFRRGPDRNFGLLVFPRSPEKRLDELFHWYEVNRTVLSPIELAAGFQRRFIQIHPFDNGNGRISRLLMDRILGEYDLPPALLRDHDLDLYLNANEWSQEVAAGVAQYKEVARDAIREAKKRKTTNTAPRIGDYDHGTWISAKQLEGSVLNTELFPGKGKAKLLAGDGRTYILYKDGFFYSDRGIPYVYREGALYPIADQTYLLYGLGGRLEDAAGVAKEGYRRTLTPQMETVYRGNLEALQRNIDGTLGTSAIEVKPYSLIAEANKTGSLYLHPWEKTWLRRSLEIRDTTPGAVLASNRGGYTEFEKAFIGNENIRISSILAQYQAVDLHYARLEKELGKLAADPEIASVIENSRKKLWEAVRHYVVRFEKEADDYVRGALPEITNPAERIALLREVPQFKLFYEYLPYTRAGYSTWDDAVRNIPRDKVYLLRNDFKAVRWTGFLSEGRFADLVKSIPGAEAFRNYARKRLAALPTSKDIKLAVKDAKELGTEAKYDPSTVKFAKFYEALEEKIFVSPYESRGVEEQFQREYVDFFLQSVDEGYKNGVSFTTRTDQMVRGDGALAFQGVTGAKYQTYIVSIPVENAMPNYGSGWYRQYEMILKTYANPFRTVKTLGPTDYVPKADPKLLEKLDAFVTTKQRIQIR